MILTATNITRHATNHEWSKNRGECEDHFHDMTAESGIHFVHTDGSSGKYYILETITAGLATLDYDEDGTFTDVTQRAGVGGNAETIPSPNFLYHRCLSAGICGKMWHDWEQGCALEQLLGAV
jgi:hypothetical protein